MEDSTVLVRGARQLLTLRGPKEARRGHLLRELAIIPDGAILIRNGIIDEVGISRRVERLSSARNAKEINATGYVVMPAFVDALTRPVYAHSGVDLHSETGAIPDLAHAARHAFLEGARALKSLPRLRLETRCRALFHDMLRHGTATIEAQTGYGLDEAGELKSLRVLQELADARTDIVPSYLAAIPSPEYAGDPSTYLRDFAEPLLPNLARRKLARFVDVLLTPAGFDLEAARSFLTIAERLGFGLKIQAQQFAPDDAVSLAVERRVTSIAHLNFASPADIDLLAASTVIATLCPGQPFHAGEAQSGATRFAPARQLIDHGAPVSLASNFNVEASPSYNMAFIVSLACRYMQMSPAESIAAATINSAYAIGRGDRTGSIEPGKQADVVIFNARDYREIPDFAGANLARVVIKGGTVVYRVANS